MGHTSLKFVEYVINHTKCSLLGSLYRGMKRNYSVKLFLRFLKIKHGCYEKTGEEVLGKGRKLSLPDFKIKDG